MKMQDRVWLWGHDAGLQHVIWPNIPGVNRMGCVDGAAYLGGIPNCCRVVFNGSPVPPFDKETKALCNFKQVVWSIIGDTSSTRNNDGGDDLDEVLHQATYFPNVTGGILDDFFRLETGDARLSLERMKAIAEALHHAERPLKLWLVYYSALFAVDYRDFLELADVITFWSWTSEELANAKARLHQIIDMTPGKKHYAGCYLWNYGNDREITVEEMTFQLDLYYRLMREKQLDGVIVCSNNIADLGLPAVEYFRKWFATHMQDEF